MLVPLAEDRIWTHAEAILEAARLHFPGLEVNIHWITIGSQAMPDALIVRRPNPSRPYRSDRVARLPLPFRW